MELEKFDNIDLRELLNKNWMTHDAMWFAHSVSEIGIEKTNKINKAAVKSMAGIEIKRLMKFLALEEITSFDELKEFILKAFEVVRADFMDFHVSFPVENVLHWEIPNCFAYEGVKKLGVLPKYECGIFDRVDSWFEVIGIEYEALPQFVGCLKYQTGECKRDYNFYFS